MPKVFEMPNGQNIEYSIRLFNGLDHKPNEPDKWLVFLSSCSKPSPWFKFDYQTGTGLRTKSGQPRADIKDVLYCLYMDYMSASELPGGDIPALKYVMSEFGCDDVEEAHKVVVSLRENADKLDKLFSRKVDDALRWVHEEDAA